MHDTNAIHFKKLLLLRVGSEPISFYAHPLRFVTFTSRQEAGPIKITVQYIL